MPACVRVVCWVSERTAAFRFRCRRLFSPLLFYSPTLPTPFLPSPLHSSAYTARRASPRFLYSIHVRLRLLASSSSLFFETRHGAEQASVCAIPSPWLSEIAAASSCLYAVTSTPRRSTTLVHWRHRWPLFFFLLLFSSPFLTALLLQSAFDPLVAFTSIGYQHAFFTPQTARQPVEPITPPDKSKERPEPRAR